MNKEAKKKWVAALRSGEYQQTRDVLRAGNYRSYCCLGVLCDLHAKETGNEWKGTRYIDCDDAPPNLVRDYFDIKSYETSATYDKVIASRKVPQSTKRKFLKNSNNVCHSIKIGLVDMNDVLRLNFKEIAQMIELYYE